MLLLWTIHINITQMKLVSTKETAYKVKASGQMLQHTQAIFHQNPGLTHNFFFPLYTFFLGHQSFLIKDVYILFLFVIS